MQHASGQMKHTSKTSETQCAFHIFACMAQVSNFNIHACVVYASYMLDWWNEKLACIGNLVIVFPSGIELK